MIWTVSESGVWSDGFVNNYFQIIEAAANGRFHQICDRIKANNDALATTMRIASLAAGEPLWRMPLVADYEERNSSKVADANNAGGGPGAITAALFLQPFVGGLPWAHLDIASVGDSPKDEYEYTKGATGFGARALLHWLELPDPLAGVGR